MIKQIDNLGLVLGALGILACIISGVVRLAGQHYLAGFEANTLFEAGTSLMIAACVFKLQAISMSRVNP